MRAIIHNTLKYFGIAAVLVVAGALAIAIRSDPRQDGKTVREWMWEYAKANRQGDHAPTTAAMQKRGSRAVPLLVRELQRQESVVHRLQLRYYHKLPQWMRKRMHDPYDVADAYRIREAAARTLGTLGAQARPAIPALQAALKDATPHVQLQAAYALWQIDHSMAGQVVPILMELHTNQYDFKYYTCLYFGEIGQDAKAAIPLVRSSLDHPNPNIRANARRALKKLEAVAAKGLDENH
jgi:hypothetical protein